MPKPRLLLADDDLDCAELLRSVLEDEFAVVGIVHDGPALVQAAARLRPDVVVTDVSMPGLDGVSAAAVILRQQLAQRVLFITADCSAELAERCLTIGASGCVPKHRAGEDLVDAIHSVLATAVRAAR